MMDTHHMLDALYALYVGYLQSVSLFNGRFLNDYGAPNFFFFYGFFCQSMYLVFWMLNESL